MAGVRNRRLEGCSKSILWGWVPRGRPGLFKSYHHLRCELLNLAERVDSSDNRKLLNLIRNLPEFKCRNHIIEEIGPSKDKSKKTLSKN
jgi:hypothetical protein